MARRPRRNAKPPKDAFAPKRPTSSYLLYTNERRPFLREQFPELKVTEISKKVSVEWRALTDERKATYTASAKELKDAYNLKMDAYKQTDNYRQHQARLAEWKEVQKEAAAADTGSKLPPKFFKMAGHTYKEPKKPKDTNAPKKPQTAYFLFSAENRVEVKAEDPSRGITDIAKILGARWRAMSDTDKTGFMEKATAAKAEYGKVLEVYKATDEYAAFEETLKSFSCEFKAFKKSQREYVQMNSKPMMSAATASKSKKRRKSHHDDSSSDSDSSDSSSGSYSSSSSSSGSYSSSD